MLEVEDVDVGSHRNIFLSFVRLVSRKIEEESIFVGAWLSIEDEVSLVLDSTSGSENNRIPFFIHSSKVTQRLAKFKNLGKRKTQN